MCCFFTAVKCMCMCEQAGVWYHIHLIYCCITTQLLAAVSETGEKKGETEKAELEKCVCQTGK